MPGCRIKLMLILTGPIYPSVATGDLMFQIQQDSIVIDAPGKVKMIYVNVAVRVIWISQPDQIHPN